MSECVHRWVRLVESAPDFPEDICVKCHIQRGHKVSAIVLSSCCYHVGTDDCVCERPTNWGLS